MSRDPYERLTRIRRTVRLAALLCALLCTVSLRAAAFGRPRVVLVLAGALSLDDLLDPQFPALNRMARDGAVGLMKCVVAGQRTPTSATLTLAVARPAEADPSDELAGAPDEKFPDEIGSVAAVYRRRMEGSPCIGALAASAGGALPRIVHPGVASLMRRELNGDRIGSLLAMADPPIRVALFGCADTDRWNRRATLLAVDSCGIGAGDSALARRDPSAPFGVADDPEALVAGALAAPADLVILQTGDTDRAEAIHARVPDAAYSQYRSAALGRLDRLIAELTARAGAGLDILLASPYPAGGGTSLVGDWEKLAPIAALGPHFGAGLITSPTTRTDGLIASIDLAPTLLGLYDVPPTAAMLGRALTVERAPSDPFGKLRAGPFGSAGTGSAERLDVLRRLDRMAVLDARGVAVLMTAIGAFCFVLAVGGLLARRLGGVEWSRRWVPALIFAGNLFGGGLLAPLHIPGSLMEYALQILTAMALLALCAYAVARLLRTTPAVATALITLLLVVVDTLCGQPLMKVNILSAYLLTGVRYYGVGNEYLGVVLGFALAGAFSWLDGRRVELPSYRQRATVAATWLALAFVLGWPGLGANSGSLVAGGAGFAVGIALLWGRRPSLATAVGGALAGLCLAFLFAGIDAALHPISGSHAGQAIRAASGGSGAGYLAVIAARKLAMNLRILVSPWLWLAASGVFGAALAAWLLVGDALRRTLAANPWTRGGLWACLAAIVAALLFKDSGVVTATVLSGAVCVLVLEEVIMGRERPGAEGDVATEG